MIQVLGLIPARAGSKRLPGKNTRLFAGRPLISWTILTAMQSPWLDAVAVTSDSQEILDIAVEGGAVAIKRPWALAHDTSLVYGSILHALSLISARYVCLLQPTSPLRITEDIDGCIAKCGDEKACVSVEIGRNAPNGAVYVGREDWLRSGGNFDAPGILQYEMPPERSIDINTLEEFEAAERLVKA